MEGLAEVGRAVGAYAVGQAVVGRGAGGRPIQATYVKSNRESSGLRAQGGFKLI